MAHLELGEQLVALDGDVVELFQQGVDRTWRFHVRFLSVWDKGTDRKGRHRVVFAPGPDEFNGFRLEVPPEREAELLAFLAEVRQAKDRWA